MKKREKEWTVKFPWGKVAMVSWGNRANPPMLLVHGYMDSAATFIPLVELLPDTHYYVGLDMPGHGKSNPFPPGVMVTQLHMVEIIRGVVEDMKWSSFTYMSHSMGFIIGMFYNYLYPGKITKMVHVDPGPPISFYYYPHHKPHYWYLIYDHYYSNFANYITGNSKKLTHDEAINLLVRNRSLTEEQAEAVISRSLVPVGDGKFRLSWEERMKRISTVALSEETLYTVITGHTPPMLIIEASEKKTLPDKKFSENILEKCCLMLPQCTSITITGGHDIHITNPEDIVPHVVDFLKETGKYEKSKL